MEKLFLKLEVQMQIKYLDKDVAKGEKSIFLARITTINTKINKY